MKTTAVLATLVLFSAWFPSVSGAQGARSTLSLTVTDATGAPVPDVRVRAEGPVPREGETTKNGTLRFQGLRAGTYRLRLEAEGFITLERELAVRAGVPASVDLFLNRAPVAPPEPPQAPVPAAVPPPAIRPDPNAVVESLSLPDWIEKNLIGRNEPLRESSVGRTPGASATVLQIREPVKGRSHDAADEMIYVIAGEGTLQANGKAHTLDAGSLTIVPRGVVFTIERRGRNPLIALSVLAGGQ